MAPPRLADLPADVRAIVAAALAAERAAQSSAGGGSAGAAGREIGPVDGRDRSDITPKIPAVRGSKAAA